jgi:hypothetical protein
LAHDLTHNAVLGVVHRSGGRTAPVKGGIDPKDRAKSGPKPGSKPVPKPVLAAIEPTPDLAVKAASIGHCVRPLPAIAAMPAPMLVPSQPVPLAESAGEQDMALLAQLRGMPLDQRAAIMAAGGAGCRFPIGNERKVLDLAAAAFRFCCADKIPGSPYCAGHHARCHIKTPMVREAADPLWPETRRRKRAGARI